MQRTKPNGLASLPPGAGACYIKNIIPQLPYQGCYTRWGHGRGLV